MVTEALWKKLKHLLDLDSRIITTRKEVTEIQNLIKNDQKLLPSLQELFEKKHRLHIEAQKHVNFEELRAQELKDRELKKRNDLDKVKNQKEYAALLKEIEKISEEQLDLEERLMNAWHALELAQKDLDATVKSSGEKKQQLEERLKMHQQQSEVYEARINELLQQRVTATNDISKEWLDRYEQMRSQIEDPIVPITGNSCSSCFYPLLSQDLVRLLKNALLPCRNCYRLLYYETEKK